VQALKDCPELYEMCAQDLYGNEIHYEDYDNVESEFGWKIQDFSGTPRAVHWSRCTGQKSISGFRAR